MGNPAPRYPTSIWDGLTENIDRVDIHSNVNPNSDDWYRIVAEVISLQENQGPVLLPPVTSSGPLFITDPDGVQQPLTSTAIVLVDATSGAITIDLPTASSMNGRTLTIKKIDSSVNTVTLDGDGSETIDDLTTQVLSSQYDSLTMVSDGTRWYII